MKKEENTLWIVTILAASLIGLSLCIMAFCEIFGLGIEHFINVTIILAKILLGLVMAILSMICLGVAYGTIHHLIHISFIKKKNIKEDE